MLFYPSYFHHGQNYVLLLKYFAHVHLQCMRKLFAETTIPTARLRNNLRIQISAKNFVGQWIWLLENKITEYGRQPYNLNN